MDESRIMVEDRTRGLGGQSVREVHGLAWDIDEAITETGEKRDEVDKGERGRRVDGGSWQVIRECHLKEGYVENLSKHIGLS